MDPNGRLIVRRSQNRPQLLPMKPANSPLFTAVSLFSGCGGSDLGLTQAGIVPIWANEISSSACELYTSVTNNAFIENADIRDIDTFPKADILVGCYPCQGFSQAGRRKSSDSINYLYREFDRALRQIKPIAFIVENVDGMRFRQNTTLLRSQLTRFRTAGYRVSWSILDAAAYGVAQHRRRLFLVGIRSGEKKLYRFPTATHGTDPSQLPYVSVKKVISKFKNAPDGSYCAEPFHWYYLSRNRRLEWNQPSSCIVAHWRHVPLHPDSPELVKVGKDSWSFVTDGAARRLSYLECAAIQGFPEPKRFDHCSIRQRFRAIGNSVPPPLFCKVVTSLRQQLSGLSD